MSEQKNLTAESFDITIHLQKDKRVYRLIVPYGAPFVETHEAIKDFAAHVDAMEVRAKELAEEQSAQSPKEEVVAESDQEVCNG
jgi:hypothetical protein